MTANDATLEQDLAQWCAPLEFAADAEVQKKRRAGVSALAKQATGNDTESLVRLAFKARTPATADGLQRIRQIFRASNDAFGMSGNDRELQLLSAATLAELFRRETDAAAYAALSVSTASFAGGRRPDLPLDLAEAAERAVGTLAEVRRRRVGIRKLESAFAKTNLDAALEKLKQQQDWNNGTAAINGLAEDVATALAAHAKAFNSALEAVRSRVVIQDEELEMLWWLVGERSWELDQPFAKVPAAERAFVLAAELAHATVLPPGPPALKSLLSRAGISDQEQFTVPAIVNACDPEWLADLVDDVDPSPVTLPMHFAIKRKLETGDQASWVAGWSAVAELDAARKLPGLTLARLFYHERLLARRPT